MAHGLTILGSANISIEGNLGYARRSYAAPVQYYRPAPPVRAVMKTIDVCKCGRWTNQQTGESHCVPCNPPKVTPL